MAKVKLKGHDHIALDYSILTALHGQALDVSEYGSGTAGTNAQVHIIYTAKNGWLSYDPDGAGSQVAIHLRDLKPAPRASPCFCGERQSRVQRSAPVAADAP